MDDRTEQLANMLSNIAEEHHSAFARTNGNDPMWALWYAKRMLADTAFASFIMDKVDPDELADLLTEYDVAFRKQKEEKSWQKYYAEQLLAKH